MKKKAKSSSAPARGGRSAAMRVGIAFIRGINVGGKNSLPMETLRALCEELGLTHARTYIQSGNVVFITSGKRLTGAAAGLESAIEKAFGFRPSVVVRSLDELRSVVERGPFATRNGLDGAKALVMFLAETPPASASAKLRALPAKPDDISLMGRELYLYFEGGVSGSKLTMPAAERAVGVPGTCRNWRTVLKAMEMGEELERELA